MQWEKFTLAYALLNLSQYGEVNIAQLDQVVQYFQLLYAII